jgi:hypothetical protein
MVNVLFKTNVQFCYPVAEYSHSKGDLGLADMERIDGGDMLTCACERIACDPNPAFIKDSELRYIAVNAAYADLWDCEAEALIGQKSNLHFDSAEQNDRDEKERRSLVFRQGSGRYVRPSSKGQTVPDPYSGASARQMARHSSLVISSQ